MKSNERCKIKGNKVFLDDREVGKLSFDSNNDTPIEYVRFFPNYEFCFDDLIYIATLLNR